MIQILKTNQVLSLSPKYFEIGRHYWFTWKKFIKPNNCTSVKYVVVLNLKVKFYWIHTLHQFIKNIFLVIFVIGKAFSMTIWQNIWRRVMIKLNVINAIINSRGKVGYNWFFFQSNFEEFLHILPNKLKYSSPSTYAIIVFPKNIA